ncbi:MAG: molybdopterin-guanine dinucleotide biosynthesis protein B [Candidatus Heimdallarchaeota archaeon]|nr:molybdopterin-guanine dinucleotide biosynthesis protein B [Candidatus Heimdallarchaeota archaeon]
MMDSLNIIYPSFFSGTFKRNFKKNNNNLLLMKVFTLIGFSNSGKTETIVEIIKELVNRGHTVNAVKSVHIEGFTMETEGKDSWRHWKAGAQTTAIRADNETTIIIRKGLSIRELIPYFQCDYLVLEGFHEEKAIPKILCVSTIEELNERLDESVFAISGQISNELDELKGIRVINGLTQTKELVNLIEERAIDSQKLV